MSDFEDKLNSILSNPEAMGQIMNLAQTLGGGPQSGGGEASGEQDPPEAGSEDSQDTSGPPSSNLTDGLGSLGIDPRMLEIISQLFAVYQSDQADERVALLNALRPFVKEDRYGKLDQAIRISKLTRVIRVALETFRSRNGEGEYV